MKQRQVIQADVVAGDRHGLANVDVIRERHGRGLDDGLRLAGGAGRVNQVPGVVAGPELPAGEGFRVPAQGDVALPAGIVEADALHAAVIEFLRNGGVFFAEEQESGRRVVHQRRQFPGRHAPVERHEYRAELAGGKQQFEELDAIPAQHRDAIAFAHPCRTQEARE